MSERFLEDHEVGPTEYSLLDPEDQVVVKLRGVYVDEATLEARSNNFTESFFNFTQKGKRSFRDFANEVLAQQDPNQGSGGAA